MFVSFPVDLPWPRPGRTVDWSTVDAQCQEVLDANPKALLAAADRLATRRSGGARRIPTT